MDENERGLSLPGPLERVRKIGSAGLGVLLNYQDYIDRIWTKELENDVISRGYDPGLKLLVHENGEVDIDERPHAPWPLKLPVVGWMGKQALHFFDSQNRTAFLNISNQLENELSIEEGALEAVNPVITSDMESFQWETIAKIKARRLVCHMKLEEDDVPVRLAELGKILEDYPEFCTLEGLGLNIDDEEEIRIRLKELKQEEE